MGVNSCNERKEVSVGSKFSNNSHIIVYTESLYVLDYSRVLQPFQSFDFDHDLMSLIKFTYSLHIDNFQSKLLLVNFVSNSVDFTI